MQVASLPGLNDNGVAGTGVRDREPGPVNKKGLLGGRPLVVLSIVYAGLALWPGLSHAATAPCE